MSDDISMSHSWHQNMKAVPKPEMMMTIHLPLLDVFLYPATLTIGRTREVISPPLYKGDEMPIALVFTLLPYFEKHFIYQRACNFLW